MKHQKYLLFECLLDIPTNLVGTKVVHALKTAHPDRQIIVITLFPEIWLHNPDVYRVYKAGAFQYFFEDYIKDQDTMICRHNPILTTEYAQAQKSLEEIWCDMYRVPVTTHTPRLFFTWREKEAVQKLTRSDKPILFIESESIPYGFGRTILVNTPTLWSDKIPPLLLREILQIMTHKGFHIVDVSENGNIPGVDKLNLNLRLKLCAIQFCSTLLALNSFSAHAAAAVNKQAVTLWTSASPLVWGYASQANITPKGDKEKINFIHSNIREFSINQIANCHFDMSTLYDAKRICDELVSMATHNTCK